MTVATKASSVTLTILLAVAAIALGGGAPPAPATIARSASAAADNVERAAANIQRAVDDTEAFATIADNVRSQLETSRRLLATQLEIERSSRSSAATSLALSRDIVSIEGALRRLRRALGEVAELSAGGTETAESSAAAATRLGNALDRLRRKFDRLIAQSRELNRKSRGYAELKDGPG